MNKTAAFCLAAFFLNLTAAFAADPIVQDQIPEPPAIGLAQKGICGAASGKSASEATAATQSSYGDKACKPVETVCT